MPAEATTGPVLFSDKLIAEELGKLSLEEREKVYEDVHGVSHLVEETPELIEESLELMEIEIHSIRQKDAYDQAKLLSNGFVTNRKFLLGFLRAESFNAKKAAARFTKYFKCKLEMFGMWNLAESITLEKIGDKSVESLGNGVLQILPNRDTQGRVVVVSMPAFFRYVEEESTETFPMLVSCRFCSQCCCVASLNLTHPLVPNVRQRHSGI